MDVTPLDTRLKFSDVGLIILLVFEDSFTLNLVLRIQNISVQSFDVVSLGIIIRKSNQSHSFQHFFHLSYLDTIVCSYC